MQRIRENSAASNIADADLAALFCILANTPWPEGGAKETAVHIFYYFKYPTIYSVSYHFLSLAHALI